MRTDLIIFDCDGVLVDSEGIANAVTAEWLTNVGLATTADEAIERYKGLSMASILAKSEAALGTPLPLDFLDTLQAETFARFERELKPIEGAEALIEWVQAKGYQTCIASSGSFGKMDVTLAITGLKHYFSGKIFSATQVMRGKPEPDLFLYACKEMGAEPQHAIVIEDSQAGVEAALAAKMRVFAYGDFQTQPGVTPVQSLSEIPSLL
ncbi:MAG: HAD family hydrolase [Pseudomonadota bacterium]